MIQSPVLLGVLYRHHVADVLYHTDHRRIARGIGADTAHIRIGDVVTHPAVLHFVLQGNHGIAEGFHTLRILTQQVQHQTHSRFPADTGKFGKLSYRFFQ